MHQYMWASVLRCGPAVCVVQGQGVYQQAVQEWDHVAHNTSSPLAALTPGGIHRIACLRISERTVCRRSLPLHTTLCPCEPHRWHLSGSALQQAWQQQQATGQQQYAPSRRQYTPAHGTATRTCACQTQLWRPSLAALQLSTAPALYCCLRLHLRRPAH